MQDNAHDHPGEPAPQWSESTDGKILLLTGISLAVTIFVSSFYPGPLVLPVLSTLLLLSALASAFTAAVLSQRIFGAHLNFWDKAVFLVFAGLIAGSFVDSEAVTAFLDGQQPAAPSTSPAPDLG